MKRLTRVEEEIMQQIWRMESGSVQEILEALNQDPKPPHSTISSVVRILENKGFVGHRTEGRSYVYFPIITKAEYGSGSLDKLIGSYFGGSPKKLLSFLVNKEDLSLKDIQELQKEFEDDARERAKEIAQSEKFDSELMKKREAGEIGVSHGTDNYVSFLMIGLALLVSLILLLATFGTPHVWL